jgi:hypothetical protein
MTTQTTNCKECPFNDPAYSLPVDVPCPLCGALGDDTEAAELCINNTKGENK